MSWLSSLGSGIKNAAVGAGHAIGSVASNPWVQGATAAALAATGVGAPAAAGLMAAERGGGALLKPGGNIGAGVKGGVEGAAMGYGASKAGGLLRGALGSGAASAVPGDGAPATDSGGGWLSGIENAAGTAGGFLKNAAGSALGAVTGQNGGGGTNPLLLALAAAQTANAAHLGQKADDYAQAATDQYAGQAPLRAAGTSGLLTPRPMQSLSGLSAIRKQNPVAARAGG